MILKKKIKYQDYKAFEDSMMGDEVVNRLNKLSEENEQLKQHNTKLINKIDFLERVIDGDV